MVKSRLPCFIVRQHALASAQHDHDMAVLLDRQSVTMLFCVLHIYITTFSNTW